MKTDWLWLFNQKFKMFICESMLNVLFSFALYYLLLKVLIPFDTSNALFGCSYILSFNLVYLIKYLYAATIKLLNPNLCGVL